MDEGSLLEQAPFVRDTADDGCKLDEEEQECEFVEGAVCGMEYLW